VPHKHTAGKEPASSTILFFHRNDDIQMKQFTAPTIVPVLLLVLLSFPTAISGDKAIPTSVAEYPGVPNPKEFWTNYVDAWEPVVLRGAILSTPAMSWAGDAQESTETKLRNKFGDVVVRIERQYEARAKHYNVDKDLNPFHSITINEFFDKVNQGADGYVISVLPDIMTKDVIVPRCMFCGDRKYSHWTSPRRWMTAVEETGLWISTEGSTYSQLHFDQPNIINCMVAGPSKTWMFVNTKLYHRHVYLDRPYHTGDVENGEQWHPSTSNHSPFRLTDKVLEHIPHTITVQHPGDCMYLPHGYLHQVKKDKTSGTGKGGKGGNGVSVAYSIMWNHAEQFSEAACIDQYPVHSDSPPIPLSLFDQHWWFSGKHLVPLGYPLPYSLKEDLIHYSKMSGNGADRDLYSAGSAVGNNRLSFKKVLKIFIRNSDDIKVVPGHEIFETVVHFFQMADCDGKSMYVIFLAFFGTTFNFFLFFCSFQLIPHPPPLQAMAI